jgi:hypothetical protein
MALREAHHPLDEPGAKASSIVNWAGCRASEDVLPAGDGGAISAPLDASESSDGRTAAPELGDWLLPYGVAVGVGRSWHTAEGNIRSPELPR